MVKNISGFILLEIIFSSLIISLILITLLTFYVKICRENILLHDKIVVYDGLMFIYYKIKHTSKDKIFAYNSDKINYIDLQNNKLLKKIKKNNFLLPKSDLLFLNNKVFFCAKAPNTLLFNLYYYDDSIGSVSIIGNVSEFNLFKLGEKLDKLIVSISFTKKHEIKL